MALVITDAIDPGPVQSQDGLTPVAMNTEAGLKPLKQKPLTLTYSGTYATGGTTLTVAQMCGLKALFATARDTGGYTIVPTYNAGGTLTLKLFWRAADNVVQGEVPNTTAIAFTARLYVFGREA